jgi:hypothetical protein
MKTKREYLLRNTIYNQHGAGCQGADGLLGATVLKVERVQNQALWKSYVGRRDALAEKPRAPSLNPEELSKAHNIGDLENRVNEVYLWHGCKPGSLEKIFEEGLDPRLAGTVMYGVLSPLFLQTR